MTIKSGKERKSFILHKDSLSVLKKLSNEQAGQLFKTISLYQVDGILPDDELISIIFEPFLNQFLRDAEAYERVCQRRREAGSSGGKQKVANASKSKQKVANVADSDSDNKNNKISNNLSLSKTKKNQSVLDAPDFLNKELWKLFTDFRLAVATSKKPFTIHAQELILKHLQQYENKKVGNANLALENSIKSGWQGVFEPKHNNQQQKQSRHNNFEQQDYYNAEDTKGFEVC